MYRARPSTWIPAVIAAFLGAICAVLLGLLGVRPIEWAILAGALIAEALGFLYARAKALWPIEVVSYTFACVLIGWPLFGFLFVLVRYWLTGQTLDH
jgi:uncharacterized membrane protein YjjB (DUF3815 family)